MSASKTWLAAELRIWFEQVHDASLARMADIRREEISEPRNSQLSQEMTMKLVDFLSAKHPARSKESWQVVKWPAKGRGTKRRQKSASNFYNSISRSSIRICQ
jgi:hypothetical protein